MDMGHNRQHSIPVAVWLCSSIVLALATTAGATPGEVLSHQVISSTQGGFTGTLDFLDLFGYSTASLGDLDGDGVGDLAVGAPLDDDGGNNHGAVWILFLNANGTVKSHQKISDTHGGFTGTLDDFDHFGSSVASLGDLNHDGVADLAVGAHGDDDAGSSRGAVWVLFPRTNGTVESYQKISNTQGGFTGHLSDGSYFGDSVASLGNLHGAGVGVLAVGASREDDQGWGPVSGAVWVLFLNSNGTVRTQQRIYHASGGFSGTLDSGDEFGSSVASLGDLNGDGVGDLVVGAKGDDDGGANHGAVWVLFLNSEGRVASHQKISATQGGFTGTLDDEDEFAFSLTSLGDLDGDGVADLAVGAAGDDDGGLDNGAVWVVFLRENGTANSHQKISATQGGFTGALTENWFGASVASLGDLDGDGVGDLAVGVPQNGSAVVVLFLDDTPECVGDMDGAPCADDGVECTGDMCISEVCAHPSRPAGTPCGDVPTECSNQDTCDGAGNCDAHHLPDGTPCTGDGDVCTIDVCDGAGSCEHPDDSTNICEGTVKSHQKISETHGGFTGALDDSDFFGISVVSLGDLDGDGVGDLVVGAQSDDDGGTNLGAVWVLFLHADGTIKSHQKISDTLGGFTGTLIDDDSFGTSVAALGDLDGDGVAELAVGAAFDDDGGEDSGAMWVLFLRADGTVKTHQKISDTQGGFTGTLDNGDLFGRSVASLGDLDGDGVGDLAVGSQNDDDGGTDRGAVWVLFLNTDGTVKAHQKISDTQGGFTGTLDNGDWFGRSVPSLGDLDGDGVSDLAVGAYGDDDGGTDRGAVWVLFLDTDGTVKSHQKISDYHGGFTGTLSNSDWFGRSAASLGDLDGDGVGELAVGASQDDDGGIDRGAAWVLFLDTDGAVTSHQKISDTQGSFTGILGDSDYFGISMAPLGDLNGDGVSDLAVGAAFDDDGGTGRGALWILFLDGVPGECYGTLHGTPCTDDGVECTDDVCISEVCEHPPLPAGTACGDPADTDCDNPDTCNGSGYCQPKHDPAGAPCPDDGNPCTDDVCDGTGTCEHPALAAGTACGDPSVTGCDDQDTCNESGSCIDNLMPPGTPCPDDGNPCTDDVCDGAGTCEHSDDDTNDCDDGAFCNGAEYCSAGQCISPGDPCLGRGECNESCNEVANNCFDPAGTGCGAPADTDCDNPDTCNGFGVCLQNLEPGGTPCPDDGNPCTDDECDVTGACEHPDDDTNYCWDEVFCNGEEYCSAGQCISPGDPCLGAVECSQTCNEVDYSCFDLTGTPCTDDGNPCTDDVCSGWGTCEHRYDDANPCEGTVKSHQKISDTQGGFTGALDNDDQFGTAVAALGDFDGDGVGDLAVGAPGDDDGGTGLGAVWILFLSADGTVRSHQKISDSFGSSLASLGDLDGDGVGDLAVGAKHDDDGGTGHGAVWVLFLNPDGTIKSHQKISDNEGGFTGTLEFYDWFGGSVASLGDLDGDGVGDMAVGAPGDDDGGGGGAVWILFLNADGTVKSHQKISDTEGGFTGNLDGGEGFGSSVASTGDLDGDSIGDLAVGAPLDGGPSLHGAVWLLFLNSDGTVKSHQKISDTQGGFNGMLDAGDFFGFSVSSLGDLDGDGVGDLAVGTRDLPDYERGVAWVLFLNTDGTVKSHRKISDTHGGFTGVLDDHDNFGRSLTSLGDLDGDGVGDLAVGASGDGDGGFGRGAVWVLFLDPALDHCSGAVDGTPCADDGVECTGDVCISDVCDHPSLPAGTACGDPADTDCDDPDTCDGLGTCLDNVESPGIQCPDDGDPCTEDVCDGIGACEHPNNGTDGCQGTVKSHQKISDTHGGFTGTLDDLEEFGSSVASLGDMDGDGVGDLAVGARWDDDGGANHGAVWVLFLNADGTVKSHQKISDTQGGFTGALDDGDGFGSSVASLGDLDGDGVGDLVVGATADDDGGTDRGAVWLLFLNANGTVKALQKISDTEGSFTGALDNEDSFGASVASLGDLDDDGVGDLAVGAYGDADGGFVELGAVWVLFLNADGTVKSHQKISETQGGFTGALDDLDEFGSSLASLGDLDRDGVGDLAVGAYGDDDGGVSRGAVWLLFLNTDGTVKSHQKISDTQGGLTATLHNADVFGRSVASLGDLNGDGVGDLAVGASGDDDGGYGHGAGWVLFLNTDGTVAAHQKISDTRGFFTGELDYLDSFGHSVASLGDLNGDGVGDLAVGAYRDDDGGSSDSDRGAVWVLFLDGVPHECFGALDGTPCEEDAFDCTDDVCIGDVCNHSSLPEGTACGDPADTDCDDPDTCDGFGTCLPNSYDYGGFAACMLGPGGGLNAGCNCFDSDDDGDVSLRDFAEFQINFAG